MNRRLWALAMGNLRRDRRGALLSAMGVTIGVGSLCFFIALGDGVGVVVRTKVFPVDATLLNVIAPQVSLGSLLGGGALDDGAVERIRSLAGVEAVYRKMALRVPAISRYDGSFFGSSLNIVIEVVGEGVEGQFLAGAVDPSRFVDPGASQPVVLPCAVSTRLLEIYDKSFAPARHLPRLSADNLVGFRFPIQLGASFVAPTESMPRLNVQCEVQGVSDRAMLAGVTLPLEAVRRLNGQYHLDDHTYSSLVVKVAGPQEVSRAAQRIRAMGWEIDDSDRSVAEQAGAAVALITGALALLSFLIVVLAAVNVGQTLFAALRARSREIALMRAVGATRGDITTLVLCESLVTGLTGGLVGAAGARVLALLSDWVAATHLPDFPFRPDSFFSFPLWLWALGLGVGACSAVLGAWLPARSAASLDPARALAG